MTYAVGDHAGVHSLLEKLRNTVPDAGHDRSSVTTKGHKLFVRDSMGIKNILNRKLYTVRVGLGNINESAKNVEWHSCRVQKSLVVYQLLFTGHIYAFIDH
jgi:hypothetical protein